MKILQGIKNYILIHNGQISEKSITEDILVTDNKVMIRNASDLQINYSGNVEFEHEIEIQIQSSKLELVELYYFDKPVTLKKEVTVAENCHVVRYVDNRSLAKKNKIEDAVKVEKNASIRAAHVDLSDGDMKAKCTYDLIGEYSYAHLRLAALTKRKEVKEYEVTLDHQAPFSDGNMDNYGVVKDESKLVIDGIGRIRNGNHKSSTYQTNKIIMFDLTCKATANPYLYIDEYDVKAGHGASVGKMDDEHLYYLQSRGLTKKDAMILVTYGYFTPVMDYIENDELKEEFSNMVIEKVNV